MVVIFIYTICYDFSLFYFILLLFEGFFFVNRNLLQSAGLQVLLLFYSVNFLSPRLSRV